MYVCRSPHYLQCTACLLCKFLLGRNHEDHGDKINTRNRYKSLVSLRLEEKHFFDSSEVNLYIYYTMTFLLSRCLCYLEIWEQNIFLEQLFSGISTMQNNSFILFIYFNGVTLDSPYLTTKKNFHRLIFHRLNTFFLSYWPPLTLLFTSSKN